MYNFHVNVAAAFANCLNWGSFTFVIVCFLCFRVQPSGYLCGRLCLAIVRI